eukprot:gene28556-35437_t
MKKSRTHDRYASVHQGFGWKVPQNFNIAQVCSGRWAAQADAARRVAVREHVQGAPARQWTFAQLQQAANRLSQVLTRLGVQRGDRVAIVMPQRFETAVAYMAVLQMGAVAMPLSMLFGPEALSFRINDSQARVAICDEAAVAAVLQARPDCPGLQTLIGVAMMGNLTGFVCSQNWFGFDPFKAERPSKAVFWSPADWAWTGGLMDALLPSLYFGRPIVAFNGRFSPEVAFEILHSHGVTHTFLFPTALKAMMKAVPDAKARYRLKLQAIMSAGEAVGDAVFAYCQQQLGVTVNEMFGQTEINYVVGNCARLWPAKPGSMGKGYPGHRVAVIDEAGQQCSAGTPGEVAVNRFDVHGHPDPVFFLGYWNNDKATQDRGALVKAYVVLSPDALAQRSRAVSSAQFEDEVRQSLQLHVRALLAPYEYPKEIEFIEQLPMTTTGKVQRRVLRLQEEARAKGAAT